MSVVIETTLGDITVDLFLDDRPRACLNFLKLCKMKYYNYNLFHTISRGFMAQTGDPTGSRSGGESLFGLLDGPLKRYFEAENEPRIKHTKMGLISFVGNEEKMIGSQFFLTLGEDLTYLDEKHCVFGEVVEGFDILEIINEVICDTDDRPYQDVRITHTVILDDPYPDPKKFVVPSRSPSPSAERLQGGRIAPDEEIDELEGKTTEEIQEVQAEREAKARATILEMVGDLPDAEMAPPENVLFVCKLNPVTNDDDLEIIFSRFGKIKSCEVIRDKKTGDSLQYAFVEFETQKACEDAYFKMDNVLIDDRRIHVDFSQSVSKVKWHGKGRGVTHYDEKGRKSSANNDFSKGDNRDRNNGNNFRNRRSQRSNSPRNIENYSERRSTSHRDMNRDRSKDRDHSLSPKRKQDFILPKKGDLRHSQNHRSNKDSVISSRNNRDRSSSPRRRKTTPPIRRDREDSRNKPNDSRRWKDKGKDDNRSKLPRRSSSRSSDKRNNRHDDEIDRYNRLSEKSSYKVKRTSYSAENKEKSFPDNRDKLKSIEKKKSYSESEDEGEKYKKKTKKHKYSSDDSDSDTKVKKVRRRSSSSSSSDSDYKVKSNKKKKRHAKKDSYDSDKESGHYKSKKSKKKKNN